MSDIDSIEAASRRLAVALDALDAAAERRRDSDESVAALGAEDRRVSQRA